jgi:hypothetical protein
MTAADDRGAALVVVLLSTIVVVTLGLLVARTATVETEIAANTRAAVQALALADGAAHRAAADLADLASWDPVLAGAATAGFFDGAHGQRRSGGSTIDLDRETAWLWCDAPACGGRSPDTSTSARPWGRNNPRWTVYASGAAAALLGAGASSAPGYVVVWVGDDAAENDADPLRDGGVPVAEAGTLENPGRGVLVLRVVAWGARGSRRELEVVVEREDAEAQTGLRVRAWREVRGVAP